jgi:CheY-like chemotaxis protein
MTRQTVLVIDDDPQFLTLMARALRQDYTVLTAEDGLEGYALLCQYQPDIVLLDVMMPMIDGWTVLRKIRSNRALSRVRVIVVTGIGRETAEHQAEQLDVTTILQKPIVPSQLVKAIREALSESVPKRE